MEFLRKLYEKRNRLVVWIELLEKEVQQLKLDYLDDKYQELIDMELDLKYLNREIYELEYSLGV